MIGISALVDPRMLIEVEAVAYRPVAGEPDGRPGSVIPPGA